MHLFSRWISKNKSRSSKSHPAMGKTSRCKHEKFRNKSVQGAYLLSCDGRVIPLRKENLPSGK